jgi:hypothetical protein
MAALSVVYVDGLLRLRRGFTAVGAAHDSCSGGNLHVLEDYFIVFFDSLSFWTNTSYLQLSSELLRVASALIL